MEGQNVGQSATLTTEQKDKGPYRSNFSASLSMLLDAGFTAVTISAVKGISAQMSVGLGVFVTVIGAQRNDRRLHHGEDPENIRGASSLEMLTGASIPVAHRDEMGLLLGIVSELNAQIRQNQC